MPEEEFETAEFKERLEEATERAVEASEHRSRWLVYLSLSTAIIAVMAAIAALESGTFSNEALMQKNDALLAQTKASDQWAYYQAKGIKADVTQSSTSAFVAAGKAPPANIASQTARYTAQQDTIREEAKKLESERDTKSKEADELLERHHHFAGAVALFQVAIALGAIAALTRVRAVWIGSLLIGGGGVVLGALALLR